MSRRIRLLLDLSRRHGEVEVTIAEALAAFVRPRPLGRILTSDLLAE